MTHKLPHIHPHWTEADAVAWLKSMYWDTTKRLGAQYSRVCPSASFRIRNHHVVTVQLDNYGRVISKRER